MRNFSVLLIAVTVLLTGLHDQGWAQSVAAADAKKGSSTTPGKNDPPGNGKSGETEEEEADSEYIPPWDFSPYKVLVWVISDSPDIDANTLDAPLRAYFDREFSSVWRVTIDNAPDSIRAITRRSMQKLTYDQIAASDPVVAVKSNHKDAVRIRVASSVAEYVKSIPSTAGLIDEVLDRGEQLTNPSVDGLKDLFKPIESDLLGIVERWKDASTEAILVPRGLALTFDEPKAKLIKLPVANLVSTAFDEYDKIYLLRIDSVSDQPNVSVVECETLMRYFGAPVVESFVSSHDLPAVAGHAVTTAFSPMVRIEGAGPYSAHGMIRASGLVQDPNSPALVRLGDLLLPMVRKNDRNGKPIIVGTLDWAYLFAVADPVALDDWFPLAKNGETKGNLLKNDTDIDPGDRLKIAKVDGKRAIPGRAYEIKQNPDDENPIGIVRVVDAERGTFTFDPAPDFPGEVSFKYWAADKYGNMEEATVKIGGEEPEPEIPPARDPIERMVKMMFYSGRAGGLQGRKNNRTFRMAMRIRPRGDATLLRLHAKGDDEFPLIGYEIYQKELTSKSMTFVGRTDWNGRLMIERNDDPLRLMYVKNGGAVLARLPMVPGFTNREVADLKGDDMRLQAEAYIRGVQNAIVDLVAIRRLLAARVKLRLQRGQMEQAEELVIALRDQPSSEALANDMTAKLPVFLKAIEKDRNQRAKVDNMFTKTREMLAKQLSQRDVRDVEAMLKRAKDNGGTLPPDDEEEEEYDPSANVAPADGEK